MEPLSYDVEGVHGVCLGIPYTDHGIVVAVHLSDDQIQHLPEFMSKLRETRGGNLLAFMVCVGGATLSHTPRGYTVRIGD